jgi:hypothetical protein
MISASRIKIVHPGIDITDLPKPGGSYVPVNIRGANGSVAIQLPISESKFFYQGTLGRDVTTEQGYEAARMCAVNVVKQIVTYVSDEQFAGINHLQIFYRCAEDWDEGPRVADGASDFLNEIFGSRGTHTRSIYAVFKLPRNFCVGVNANFTVNDVKSAM